MGAFILSDYIFIHSAYSVLSFNIRVKKLLLREKKNFINVFFYLSPLKQTLFLIRKINFINHAFQCFPSKKLFFLSEKKTFIIYDSLNIVNIFINLGFKKLFSMKKNLHFFTLDLSYSFIILVSTFFNLKFLKLYIFHIFSFISILA